MRGQENLSVVTKEGGRRKTYREREKRKDAPCGVGNHLDRSWPENWHGPIIIGYLDIFQTHLMSQLWWKLPRSLTSHKHCWHCWELVIWSGKSCINYRWQTRRLHPFTVISHLPLYSLAPSTTVGRKLLGVIFHPFSSSCKTDSYQDGSFMSTASLFSCKMNFSESSLK